MTTATLARINLIAVGELLLYKQGHATPDCFEMFHHQYSNLEAV